MLGKLTPKYKEWQKQWDKYEKAPKNISVVNLGSSMSYYDFDYKYWSRKCKGFNMASAPQTLAYDYKVLQMFSDYLAKDCVVIISLAEFSLLVDKYSGDYHNIKYYGYLRPDLIDGYSKKKDRLIKTAPGILYPKMILGAIKDIVKRLTRHSGKATMTIEQMSDDLFNSWKCEFGWKNGFALNDTQRRTIEKTSKTLYSIIEYIKSRGWRAVVVIPPFPKYLIDKLPRDVLKECLWDEIDSLKEQGISVLNYTKDSELTRTEYYKTAVALNENGKKIFNQRVESCIIEIRKEKADDGGNMKQSNTEGKSYTLRNGISIPWIAYGTGVIWKYTRSPLKMANVIVRELLSSVKHLKLHRELYGNINIKKILSEAYISGYKHFDTGRIYGKSEKYIGLLISDKSDVFIASKCSAMDVERKYSPNSVRGNLELTLNNLRLETLDLYMLHWPEGEHWLDYYREIISLYHEGKVKSFGICNVTVEHLKKIEDAGLELPMVIQEECHPFYSRVDVREYCKQHSIQYEAHTATARSGELVRKCEVLQSIARAHGKNATQVIIRWHYQNGVIPVVNMFNKKHMIDNLDVFDFSLSDDEMRQIEALNNNTILLDATGIDDPNYIYND